MVPIFRMLFFLLILHFRAQSIAQKYSFVREKMASPFGIIISTQDTTALDKTIEHCYALVDTLAHRFSDYLPTSELRTLDQYEANSWFNCSADMFRILRLAQNACIESSGTFDVTIGNLTKEWRKPKHIQKTFQTNWVKDEKQFMGCNQYKLDTIGYKILKQNNHFSFDLGGIAKGYIAQAVSNFLYTRNLPSHLIDAGGDLVVGDAPYGSPTWKIALLYPHSEDVFKVISINNKAIATSGGSYKYIEDGGNIFSHIINPKSAKPIVSSHNITILTLDGSQADWLATACSIIDEKSIRKYVKKNKDVSVLKISSKEKGGYKIKSFGKKIEFLK